MEYRDVSVLIFGAGGRQSLPVCRGFYKLGCKVTVYCANKLDTGYLTKFSHAKLLYDPNNKEGEDFHQYGLRLVKDSSFDLVVPLGDASATFLSKHKEEVGKHTKIAVNDWDIFKNVIDKSNTMRICQDNNIPAPRTVFTEDPVEEIKRLGMSYPVVVKPKTGVGSIGFNIVRSEESLKGLLQAYNNENGPLLVQEYIEQDGKPQYGVDLFRDRDGITRAVFIRKSVRWYPLDGGTCVLSVSCHDQNVVDSCVKLLDALDWNGYANMDLVWDAKENIPKILEVNGRTGANVKMAFLAGIDFAEMILQNEMGLPVSSAADYEDGLQMSFFLADCMWFLKSKNRFTAKPSWFARWKIKDAVFYWDDILPSIGYLITSIQELGETMRKRKRSAE